MMIKYNMPKISDRVYAIGARDRNRRVFDGLMPLTRGTSSNSYLVIGREKTALIDLAVPGFEKSLPDKVSTLTDIGALDYVILNHAEPDLSRALGVSVQLNLDRLGV